MKKPKHLFALQVTRKTIADLSRSPDQLLDESGPTEKEWYFLRSFLSRRPVISSLGLLDILTNGPGLDPIVSSVRPTSPEECDSLQALSDLWSELERFVMKTREEDEPDAHELYDLLADPHLRELLVAYDDISNCRYVVEDFDLVPIYVESKLPQKHLTREKITPLPSVPGFSGEGILPDDSLVEVTVISQDSEVYVPGSPPEPSEMRSQYKPSGTRDVSQVTSSSNTEATQRLSSAHTAKPRRPSASGYVSNLVGRFESEDPMTVASVRRSATKHSTTTPRPPAGDDSPRPLNRDHSEFAADVSNTLCNPPNKEDKILLNNHSESSTILSPVSHPRHLGDARPLSGSACSPVSRRITSQAKISCPSPLVESPTATSRVPSSVLSKKYTQHSSKTILSDPDTSSAYQSESLPHRMKQKSSSHKVNKDGTLGAVMVDSLPRHSSRPSSHRSTRSPVKSSMNHPKPGEVRRVRLRRDHPGEEVGITIALRTPSPPEVERSSNDSPVLAIQRVMVGSLADRCGTLFPGDILLEFNGCPVRSKDQVLELMRQASGALEFDILVKAPFSVDTFLKPGLQHKQDTVHSKRYIRTFFDYNAQKDALMPTGDVGLSFKAGEVLELIDDQDPNWWQVRPLNDSRGKARLIPSQTLEERRKAFNEEKTPNSSLLKARRKIKKFFRASDASALRLRADLWSYEEVVPWPQSTIPCLLLLGVTGVGRRNLKVLLVNAESKRFAYPMSDTTDPAASTNQFCILSKSQMEADVRSGAYVEWGKIDGHFYGIRFAAIRKIIASGRTAVLDCEPQTVHLLHQPEYNPCAVFVAPPTFEVAKRMMEEGVHAGVTKNTRSDAELNAMIDASKRYASQYRHLYFHTLINSDMRHSVDKLRRLVSRLEQQPSWIPSGWAYELSVPALAGASTTFVPGSSSLSSLGIHGLPPSRPSTITRSILSGISEASSESAHRLSRPPSIASGVTEGRPSERRRSEPRSAPRLYEKRRKPRQDFRPLSPVILEQDTPSDSGLSYSVTAASTVPTARTSHHIRSRISHGKHDSPDDFVDVTTYRRSPSLKPHRADDHPLGSDDVREAIIIPHHSDLKDFAPKVADPDDDDDAISDTSTESDCHSSGV